MKPRITASALERVFECPTSVLLPQIWSSSEDSKRGGSIHAFVRNVLAGHKFEIAVESVEPQWQATCRAIDFTKLGQDLRHVRAEMAYAWDVKTRKARELGENIGRSYEVEEYEIAGTSDIEGDRLDDIPVVCDIKTGQPVTLCKDNAQMLFHAVVRQQQTEMEEVQARILYIGNDGSVNIDQHTFDTFTLDEFADSLEEVDAAVRERAVELETRGTAPVHRGEWCRYCPAMQACPAWTGMARRMVVDLDDLSTRIAALTPQQQGEAWVLAKQAESLVEVVIKGLKGLAKQGPIVLPDGSVVKPIQFTRNDFDARAAIQLLRKKGVSSEEISKTCYRDHAVEQVRRTAKPRTKKAKALPAAPALELPAPSLEEAADALNADTDDFDNDGEAA